MCITHGMGRKREKIREKDLQGFKYFKVLSSLLENLHDAGCERDIAGNRKLHMDQYVSLPLLEAYSWLSSSAQPQAKRYRAANVCSDYCLYADGLVDRQKADTANI